jgi:hypothetical protein
VSDRPQHGQQMEMELSGLRVEVARVPEQDLEARRKGVRLDEMLPRPLEGGALDVEIARSRQTAAGRLREEPPQPSTDRDPAARLLEVDPRRRAVYVTDEGIEFAPELRERLPVGVGRQEGPYAPLVLVMAGQVQPGRFRRSMQPVD